MKKSNFFQRGVAVVSLFLIHTLSIVYGQSSTNHATSKDGIQFFIGSWKQTKEMAGLMKKPIFVNVYNNYDKACKEMQYSVFTHSRVEKYYRDNFVNLKVNLNSKEGLQFREKYKLKEYPSLLFFTTNGKLIFKESGVKAVAEFMKLGQQAYQHNMSTLTSNSMAPLYTEYLDLKVQYANGNRTPDFLRKYAYERKKFNDSYLYIVNEYLKSDGFNNPISYHNLKFVFDFSDNINHTTFSLLLEQKAAYEEQFGQRKVDKKIKNAIKASVITAATSKNIGIISRIKKIIERAKVIDAEAFTVEMEMLYYESTEEWGTYMQLVNERLFKNNQISSHQTAILLDRASRKIGLTTSGERQLEKALGWSQTSLSLISNKFRYIETNAIILYKLGKKAKAQKEAERAIEVARKNGGDYTSVLKLLDLMRDNKAVPIGFSKH